MGTLFLAMKATWWQWQNLSYKHLLAILDVKAWLQVAGIHLPALQVVNLTCAVNILPCVSDACYFLCGAECEISGRFIFCRRGVFQV